MRDLVWALACGLVAVPVYWFFRELVPTADGDRVWRMVEGGVWFYRRSLLAQASARTIYVLGAPFGWNGIDALHAYSVLSGGVFVFASVLLARILPRRCRWPLFLLLTAGFGRVFCGHIEYYALAVAATALYLLAGSLALGGRVSLFWAGLAYSFLCWVHLMGWFIFPSVLFLWVITGGRAGPGRDLALGLVPLGLIFLFLRGAHLLGADLHGQLYGRHWLCLFDVGDTGMWYPFFSVRHFGEWFRIQLACGAMYWPLFLLALSGKTISLLWKDRFLLFFTAVWLPYLAYSLFWHIDLGPMNDWDLFTPLFVPMAWIVGTLLHRREFSRHVVLILVGLVLVAALPAFQEAADRARIGCRATGSVKIVGWEETPVRIYLDGRPRARTIEHVIMGEHELRVIAPQLAMVHRQIIGVPPGDSVRVALPPSDPALSRDPGLVLPRFD